MKTRTYFKHFFSCFLLVLVVSACFKKGEEDPFISLRSRTNRLSGTWKLISGIESVIYTTNGNTVTSDVIYEPGIKKITVSGSEIRMSYLQKLTFDNKSNFSRMITENFDETKENGSWMFIQKNKKEEVKNKESILISITQNETNGVLTVNSGVYLSQLFFIHRLTNKELILKGSTTQNFTSGDIQVDEYELIFEKE